MPDRNALVRIHTGPVGVRPIAQLIRDAGVTVTCEGTEHVHCILAMDPEGWGILPALCALEDRIAANIGRPGSVLGHATVLRTLDSGDA